MCESNSVSAPVSFLGLACFHEYLERKLVGLFSAEVLPGVTQDPSRDVG